MVMVLLALGIEENNAVLFQVSYTKSELKNIIESKLRRYRKSDVITTANRQKHRLYLTFYTKGSKTRNTPTVGVLQSPNQ